MLFDVRLGGVMTEKITRRKLFGKITVTVAGAAVVLTLPERWVKPMIESIVTPADAAFTPPPTTTTTTTTTTTSNFG
jgi:hypothetical protein